MNTPPERLSPLARAIYKLLRKHLRAKRASITYGELARELVADPAASPTSIAPAVHPRSPKLHAALGEVTRACRAAGLPCLPAMVTRRDTERPSDGYYRVAHPRVRSEQGRVAAWEREHALVVHASHRFPAVLP